MGVHGTERALVDLLDLRLSVWVGGKADKSAEAGGGLDELAELGNLVLSVAEVSKLLGHAWMVR